MQTLPLSPRPDWLDSAALSRLFGLLGEDQLRAVGGCVRNTLLGLPVTDIDLATRHAPEQVMERLSGDGVKTLPTGLKHGTVTALIEGRPFEITTLRRDLTCDGRHAEVSYTDDWEADARRRDFTVNALYLDQRGMVYDMASGLEDLEAGRLRFIGAAEARIAEDALRILRFFRFSATFPMLAPDQNALAACAARRRDLDSLSGERIRQEMLKLLAARDPLPALLAMEQAHILPLLALPDKIPSTFTRLMATEKTDGLTPDPMRRLLLLLDAPAQTDVLADRWKLSGKEAAFLRIRQSLAASLPDSCDDAALKSLIRRHGGPPVADALLARWLQADKSADTASRKCWLHARDLAADWQAPVFPLSGQDLLAAGFREGPEMGALLARLEEVWESSGYRLTGKELLALAQGGWQDGSV